MFVTKVKCFLPLSLTIYIYRQNFLTGSDSFAGRLASGDPMQTCQCSVWIGEFKGHVPCVTMCHRKDLRIVLEWASSSYYNRARPLQAIRPITRGVPDVD